MAWTTLNDEPFRILEARALGATDWQSLAGEDLQLGELKAENGRTLVCCGKGSLLELKLVQPAGKKPMSSSDWARGLAAGKRVIYV
jgi:methionyl-tRNA formyltransferase